MKNKSKSKGLGDTIEKITETTGIKKIVHGLFGDDCGCEERKDKLNKLFPYKKVECLTEEEFNYLNDFGFNVSTIDIDKQKILLKIYNRVFNDNRPPTSCGSCWIKIIDDLKNVFENYKNQ